MLIFKFNANGIMPNPLCHHAGITLPQPWSLLRPARIPDFNKKQEDDPNNLVAQRSRDGAGLCWQTGGICVDKSNNDGNVCQTVNSDMEVAEGYRCYSNNQVCCIVSQQQNDEVEIFPWARVFSLNSDDQEESEADDDQNEEEEQAQEQEESEESNSVQNLRSSQHHICGHGDLKVRCLERGQTCRRSANKFFSNSIISEEQFTKSEQSVADCAEKCRNDESCESFTYKIIPKNKQRIDFLKHFRGFIIFSPSPRNWKRVIQLYFKESSSK